MKKWFIWSLCLFVFSACSEDNNENDDSGNKPNNDIGSVLKLESAGTLTVGKDDNAEIIRALPGKSGAILISSKAHRITRLTFDAANGIAVAEQATKELAEDDEFTSGLLYDEHTMLVTHTILEKASDASDAAITGCGGEIVALSLETGSAFGNEIARETVGAMPDAVGLSPDKKWAVSCDEHDSEAKAWGKCSVETILPSVTILDMAQGVDKMKAVAKIRFTENKLGPREPEYAAIASDNDTVMVTLQDSDEVAIFKISEVMAQSVGDNGIIELDESAVKIVALPTNEAQAQPWPDGIVSFDIGGKSYFVIAGEWNDTIITLDTEGNVVSNIQIKESEVPSNYPCVKNGSDPLYSPDSLAVFTKNGKTFVAATLRHAGAVIVYDYSTPASPKFSAIAKVGANDSTACSKDGSSVKPEGISSDGELIWVANEKESSVSVIRIQ